MHLPDAGDDRLQVLAQNRVVAPVLRNAGNTTMAPPWAVRLFDRFPLLQRIPARIVGVGVRPEHIKSPAAPPAA